MENLMHTVMYYTAIEDEINFSIFLDKLKAKFYGCNTDKNTIQKIINYIANYDLGDYLLTNQDLCIICQTLNLPNNTLIID